MQIDIKKKKEVMSIIGTKYKNNFNTLLTIVILLFLIKIKSFSANITVGNDFNIKSIKTAISLSKNNDTITIKKGLYKENNIQIDKSLYIIGEERVIIDCEMKKGFEVVSVDSIVIKNISIKNIGISFIEDFAAIKITSSKNIKIIDCNLENVFFGIFLAKSKKGIISGNTIKSKAKSEFNSGNGIHLLYCSEINIINNNLDNLRDGIYLEFVDKSIIKNNISNNNLRYGLHFMFSNNDEYHSNSFRNNGAGVAVMFSKFIKMYNNVFYKNWGSASYGLLLKEINDGEIYNNVFEENTIGINAEGSNRIKYINNNFISNGWAVKIHGACYNNYFTENNFISNTFEVSYKGRLNGNSFEKNYWSQYSGYDFNKDNIGDIPYRPIKLFSYIVNRTPESIILLRSLFIDLINFSEKVSPLFTPNNLVDKKPLMRKIK